MSDGITITSVSMSIEYTCNHHPGCGHPAIKHNDHVGYLDRGQLHCMVPKGRKRSGADSTEDDEHSSILHQLHAPEPDFIFVRHRVESFDITEDSKGVHDCDAHLTSHVHSRGCGHTQVPHDDHIDYLVGDHLHHDSGDGTKCEDHGTITRLYEHKYYHADRKVSRKLSVVESVKDEKKVPLCKDRKAVNFISMMVMTGSFFFVELVVGIMIGSLALQADAYHMASDIISLIVGYSAMKMSRAKKTHSSSYGLSRFEVIGALINATFLMATCFQILIEAVQRFFELEEVEKSMQGNIDQLMIVGGIGLAINIVGLFLFGGHGHSHGGGGHGHAHGGGGHKEDHHGHSHSEHIDEDHHGHSHHEGHDDHHSHSHSHGEGEHKEEEHHGHSHHEGHEDHHSHRHGEGEHKDEDHHGHSHHEGHEDHHSHSHSDADVEDGKLCGHDHDGHDDHGGSHGSHGDMNQHGVFLHVLGDALGSVAVIISGLFIKYTDFSWRYIMDPIMSLIIVVIITYGTIPLFKECVRVLLQKSPKDIDPEAIRQEIMKVDGVKDVHDFHIWTLSDDKIIASVHIVCPAYVDFMKISDRVKMILHRKGIHSTTIQPEFVHRDVDVLTDGTMCHEPLCGDADCGKNQCCPAE